MSATEDIAALVQEGIKLAEAGRAGEAIAVLERALALKPGDAQLHWILGTTHRVAGQRDRAIKRYRAALDLDPGHEASLGNLAEIGDPEEAVERLDRALAAFPGRAPIHFRRGTVLNRLGRGAQAVESFARAIAIDPGVAPFHINHGIALRQAGRLEESVAALDRALQIKPGDALAHWNRALSLLGLGRLEEGWRDYEFRLRLPSAPRSVPLPAWNGEAGKSVLVRREQGLGDELLFANCLPDLLRLAPQAAVECDRRLAPLYRRSFPSARIVPVARPLPGQAEPAPDLGDVEAAIALGSLPGRFRRRLEDFPATRGYLKPDPAQRQRWSDWLAGQGGGRKTGLCWRSSQAGGSRDQRYARLDALLPALTGDDDLYVSLQLNLDPAERAAAGRHVVEAPGLDLRDDIDGVAALIAALDRVITVDSWILSLAGALGVPTLFLATQRDWATLGSDRVPWAPGVQVVFVQGGDWAAALRQSARR